MTTTESLPFEHGKWYVSELSLLEGAGRQRQMFGGFDDRAAAERAMKEIEVNQVELRGRLTVWQYDQDTNNVGPLVDLRQGKPLVTKLSVKPTQKTFEHWSARPYLSDATKENIRKASVVAVPIENWSGPDEHVFPVGTNDLFQLLRDKLPPDSVEIAIDDADYKEVALHSALIIVGGFLVTAVVAPVVVNVVSEMLKRRLVSEPKGDKPATVRFGLTVVDANSSGSRAAHLTYEGPAPEFDIAMQRALNEIPKVIETQQPKYLEGPPDNGNA